MSITIKELKILLVISLILLSSLPVTTDAGTTTESYPSYYYLLSSVPKQIEVPFSNNNTTYQKYTPYPTINLTTGQLLVLEIKTGSSVKIRITTSVSGLITEQPISPEKIFFCPLTKWLKEKTSLYITIEVMPMEHTTTMELVLKTFQLVFSTQPKETVTALSFYEGKKDQLSVIGVLLPPINTQAILQITISPIPHDLSLNNQTLKKSPDGKVRVSLLENSLYLEILVNGSVSWVSAVVRYFYSLSPGTEGTNTDVLLGIMSVFLFLAPLALRHRSLQNTSKRARKFMEKGE